MLYHFSEQSGIVLFEPRTMDSRPDEPAMVWTIDSFHAPHYFFPRECPRVCIWPYDKTTDKDKARFFGHSGTDRIVAIESGWYERMCSTPIYRYAFDPEPFELYDRNAGYYTTTRTVRPAEVTRLDNLPGQLADLGIELRITPSLLPLRDAILSSTVNFSMIRMRNAKLTG